MLSTRARFPHSDIFYQNRSWFAPSANIRKILDELFDPSAAGEWNGQVTLESLSLLCGGAGAGIGWAGGGFADTEAFVKRLTFKLQQGLNRHKVKNRCNKLRAKDYQSIQLVFTMFI